MSERIGGEITLVALGGNAQTKAGGPRDTVRAALDVLRAAFPDLTESALYQTPAFPAGAGPDFVNAACAFRSDLPPADLLARLHRIEAEFDRIREVRWGQRTLDLDLIAAGQTVAPDLATFRHWRDLPPDQQQTRAPDTLILPHPRLQDRAFVLVPLAEVAPDWVHPVLGLSVAELRDRLGGAARAEITRLG